ncbi:anti-sigma factor [Roseicyclus mahoneyensis]|uniref:Regulator of SigK n=1 Tax=Roseicyclus mahoneyensis TaxID=164332 RepID=A0A316GM30_9RHOB|nr:anti-sigma factor [Roseicyclus mahoneyensis]PWK60492.1 anti-sigma-K factor RskA [Roseicyclus mahoneyensis]
MTDRPDDQMPELEARAAEYALGLLEASERAAFEAQLRDDPVLARLVTDWQARFASMADAEVAPVTPPARLEAAIMDRLSGTPAPARAPLWDRVAFWRGVSALSGAVAAVAVGVAVLPMVERPGERPEVDKPAEGIPPGTILMTHLLPVEGSGLGLAITREPGGALQVLRVAGGPSEGRAQEVWLVLDEATPPISLGVLGEEPLTTLTPEADVAALFGVGAAIAISDEPPGGSPTGQPTGAILALGALVAL